MTENAGTYCCGTGLLLLLAVGWGFHVSLNNVYTLVLELNSIWDSSYLTPLHSPTSLLQVSDMHHILNSLPAYSCSFSFILHVPFPHNDLLHPIMSWYPYVCRKQTNNSDSQEGVWATGWKMGFVDWLPCYPNGNNSTILNVLCGMDN